MTRRPLLQDQNVLIPSIEGSKCRARHFWPHDLVGLMLWSLAFMDQNNAKATAAGSEGFDPQHWGTKCRAMHFWYHDLVDLMVWSPQFRNQNDAKATAAGSEWIEPQPLGIEITRCTKLRDDVDFWSQTLWNLFGNQYVWFVSLSRFLKCTYCFYAIRILIMWEFV